MTDSLPILGAIFVTIISPIVTRACKDWWPSHLKGLGVPVNGLASLVLYLLGWWVITEGDRAELVAYVMAALASAALGSGVVAVRDRVKSSASALDRPLER